MNDNPKKDDELKKEIKEGWEETIQSDSELLEGMEKEVMEEIGSRGGFNPASWLTKARRSIARLVENLSPRQRYAVGGGAVAAVLLGLLLGWIISPSPGNGNGGGVIFKVSASNARSVNLAGDFSGFEPIEMEDEDGDGVWTVRLDLKKGKYEYYYLINGEKAGKYPLADEVVRDWDDSKNGIRFIEEERSDDSDKRDAKSA